MRHATLTDLLPSANGDGGDSAKVANECSGQHITERKIPLFALDAAIRVLEYYRACMPDKVSEMIMFLYEYYSKHITANIDYLPCPSLQDAEVRTSISNHARWIINEIIATVREADEIHTPSNGTVQTWRQEPETGRWIVGSHTLGGITQQSEDGH